jgi:Ribbon-helix-helix protein, copG family
MPAQGLVYSGGRPRAAHGAKLTCVSYIAKLTYMEKTQVYLRKEELDALRKVAARSRRSVAALVREAVRKVVLMPAAEGPIAIWDGEPKRTSLDHDSVHDEP